MFRSVSRSSEQETGNTAGGSGEGRQQPEREEIMKIEIGNNEFEVDFDYTPPSKGSRDSYGVQLEPDEPYHLELTSVEFQGAELVGLLTDEAEDLCDKIEEAVLEQIKEDQS